MAQLPTEGNTPFSLPGDVPEVMPIDYPDLNGNVDIREDDGPDIDVEPIRWQAFFKISESNNLAFLYRTKVRSGTQRKFCKFMDRIDINRVTEARRVA